CDDLVTTATRDAGHGHRVFHPLTQSHGERCEVPTHPLRSGRVTRRRCVPACRREKTTRSRIGQLRPRREEPHVPPTRYRGGGTITALEDKHVDASLDKVRRGGKALRPRPDDNDGKLGHHRSPQIDILRYENPHSPIEDCQYVPDCDREPADDHRCDSLLRATHHVRTYR